MPATDQPLTYAAHQLAVYQTTQQVHAALRTAAPGQFDALRELWPVLVAYPFCLAPRLPSPLRRRRPATLNGSLRQRSRSPARSSLRQSVRVSKKVCGKPLDIASGPDRDVRRNRPGRRCRRERAGVRSGDVRELATSALDLVAGVGDSVGGFHGSPGGGAPVEHHFA
jgi:hypothetical protein